MNCLETPSACPLFKKLFKLNIIYIIGRWIKRFFRRCNETFTPAALTAGVFLFFSGCGEMPGKESAALAPTPSGFYVDSTTETRIKDIFHDVEECANLKGDFESLTFILMPPAFPCTDLEGKKCDGEFTTPNTIKFSYFWAIRHETLHYLLYLNTGNPDPSHTNKVFESCL